MKNKPIISVIIPLYNKETSIKKTIESVLEQDFIDFELLIIDDGSTDNSVKVVSSIKDDRLRIISKSNGGVSDARNYGLKNAQSEYIFFLDADDTISSNSLSVLINLTQKYKEESIFVANFRILRPNNSEIHYCRGKKECLIKNPLKALWYRKIFPRTGSMLIKKFCFEQVGYFRTDISIYEDLELIIRLLKRYNIVYSPAIILTYNTDYNALSKSILPLSKEFSYYVDLKNTTFFEHLILADNICHSYITRIRQRDSISRNYLVQNNKKFIFSIFFAYIYKRLIDIYNKLILN